MADNDTVDPAATVTEGAEAGTTTPASAETLNAENGEKGPVPYDRFEKVTHDNRTLKEETEALATERDELQARVDKMATAPKPTAEVGTGAGNGELPTPPAGLSERQTVEWYVRDGSRRLVEEELGMSLKDAAAVISAVPSAAKYTQERQWERLCEKHGLDATNKDAMEVASGLAMSAGEKGDPDKIVGRTAEILGVKKPSSSTGKPPSPTNVETDGVGSQLTVADFMPTDKDEASKAAAEGKQAPFLSTTEINRRMAKLRAGKGTK